MDSTFLITWKPTTPSATKGEWNTWSDLTKARKSFQNCQPFNEFEPHSPLRIRASLSITCFSLAMATPNQMMNQSA